LTMKTAELHKAGTSSKDLSDLLAMEFP